MRRSVKDEKKFSSKNHKKYLLVINQYHKKIENKSSDFVYDFCRIEPARYNARCPRAHQKLENKLSTPREPGTYARDFCAPPCYGPLFSNYN